MKQFSEIKGIKPLPIPFVGKKITVAEVINKPIEVYRYHVRPSVFYDTKIYVRIQIKFNNEKRMLTCSSFGLLHYLQQLPPEEFPFQATIIQDNKYYHFK